MKVEAGTVIGHTTCTGCEAEKELKVNRAGGVYYFCANPIEWDENGKCTEKCFTRFNLGRRASEKMINDYLEQGEKTNETAETEPREKAKDDGEANPRGNEHNGNGHVRHADTENARGFGAGIKHFLTGDE